MLKGVIKETYFPDIEAIKIAIIAELKMVLGKDYCAKYIVPTAMDGSECEPMLVRSKLRNLWGWPESAKTGNV